jgi:hypothetical protein
MPSVADIKVGVDPNGPDPRTPQDEEDLRVQKIRDIHTAEQDALLKKKIAEAHPQYKPIKQALDQSAQTMTSLEADPTVKYITGLYQQVGDAVKDKDLDKAKALKAQIDELESKPLPQAHTANDLDEPNQYGSGGSMQNVVTDESAKNLGIINPTPTYKDLVQKYHNTSVAYTTAHQQLKEITAPADEAKAKAQELTGFKPNEEGVKPQEGVLTGISQGTGRTFNGILDGILHYTGNQEQAKKISDRRALEDYLYPQPITGDMAKIGNVVGSMLPYAIPAIIAPEATPEMMAGEYGGMWADAYGALPSASKLAQAAIGATMMGLGAKGETFHESYQAAKDAGLSEEDATKRANHDSNVAAGAQAVNGLLMPYNETMLKNTPILKYGEMNALKKSLAEAGVTLAEFEATGVAEDALNNKPIVQGLIDRAQQVVALEAAMKVLHAAPKALGKSAGLVKQIVETSQARRLPDVEAQFNKMVQDGQMTQEQADKYLVPLTKTAETLSTMPQDLPTMKEQAILPLMQEKQGLLERKKQLDKVFHPNIDEKIASVDKEISDILAGKGNDETIAERNARIAQDLKGEGVKAEDLLHYGEHKDEIHKIAENDSQDQTGVSSQIGEGKEPIKTESDQSTGTPQTSDSGVVQGTPETVDETPHYEQHLPEIDRIAKEKGIELSDEDKHHIAAIVEASKDTDKPSTVEQAIDFWQTHKDEAPNEDSGNDNGATSGTQDKVGKTTSTSQSGDTEKNTEITPTNGKETKTSQTGSSNSNKPTKTKPLKKTTPRRQALNEAVAMVNEYNALSDGSRGKGSTKGQQLRMDIKKIAADEGLHVHESGKVMRLHYSSDISPRNVVKINNTGEGNQAEAENHTPLKERSKETQDLFTTLDGAGHTYFPSVESAEATKSGKPKRMSESQRKQAVEDVKNGRQSKGAENLLNALDKAISKNEVEIHDSTSGTERVSLDEYKDFIKQQKEQERDLYSDDIEKAHKSADDYWDSLTDEEKQQIFKDNEESLRREMGEDGPTDKSGPNEKAPNEEALSKEAPTTDTGGNQQPTTEGAAPKEKLRGKDKIADATHNILSKLGGIKELDGNNNIDLAHEFKRLAEGLIEEGQAKLETIYEDVKKYLGDKWDDKLKPHLDEAIKALKPEDGEPKQISTKNALNNIDRESNGLTPVDLKPYKESDGVTEAKKLVDSGEVNPQDIVDELLSGKPIQKIKTSIEDEHILRYHKLQLENQKDVLIDNKAKLQEIAKENPDDEQAQIDVATADIALQKNYDAQERLDRANVIGGYIWGETGRARQIIINEQNIVQSMIGAIKNIYGDEIPSEVAQQIKELQQKHDELVAENKKIQDRLDKLEAQKKYDKIRDRANRDNRRTADKETLKKQREEIVARAKDKVSKILERIAEKGGGKLNLLETDEDTLELVQSLVPDISDLARNYAKEKIGDIGHVVDKIADDLKDITALTKEHIRDVIAGRYAEKRPLTDDQKKLNDLRSQARIQGQIEDVQNGIVRETKAKGERSPEVQELQKKLNDLIKNQLNESPQASAADLKKQADALQRKIDKGVDTSPKFERTRFDKDANWIANQKERENLMLKLKQMQADALNSQKSWLMKGQDYATRWMRRGIFFLNANSLAHLSSAAVFGSILHRIPEEVVGLGLRKIFPRLAKNSPIEGGGAFLESTAKFYSELSNMTKLAKNTYDLSKTGYTPLKREHEGVHTLAANKWDTSTAGKALVSFATAEHIPFLETAYAGSHPIIKDPIQRATFEASLISRLKWMRDNQIDYTHPLSMEVARQQAWRRAQYEIFQDEPTDKEKTSDSWSNRLSPKSAINKLRSTAIENVNKGDIGSRLKGEAQYAATTLYSLFQPVVSVPSNMAKRTLLTPKIPYNLFKAFVKDRSLKDPNFKFLPEESDVIMRQLKKGAVNTAYYLAGAYFASKLAGGLYTSFYPNKQRHGEAPPAGSLNVGGMDVPEKYQHGVYPSEFQMGAQFAIIFNHYANDKGESFAKALSTAIAANAGTHARGFPTARFAEDLLNASKDAHGLKQFGKSLGRIGGMQHILDIASGDGSNKQQTSNGKTQRVSTIKVKPEKVTPIKVKPQKQTE